MDEKFLTIDVRYHVGARYLRGPYKVELDEATYHALQGLLTHRGGSLSELLPRMIRESYRAMMAEPRAGGVPPRWFPMKTDVGSPRMQQSFQAYWEEATARGVTVKPEQDGEEADRADLA